MNIRFDFPNIGQAIAAFSKDLIAPIGRVIETEFVPRVIDVLKGNMPSRTGKMQSSLFMSVLGINEYGVSSNVDYEKWVRYGTLPHMIYPVNKKALWWQGATHPSAYARNPGIVPNDYVERSSGQFNAEAMATYERIFGVVAQEVKF